MGEATLATHKESLSLRKEVGILVTVEQHQALKTDLLINAQSVHGFSSEG